MHYKPSGSYMNNKSLKCLTDTWNGVLISQVFNNGFLNVSMHQHFKQQNCLIPPPPQSFSVPGRSINIVNL